MVYEGNCRLGDLFENRRERGRHGLPILSVTMNDGLVVRDALERRHDTTLSPEEHLLVKPGDIAYNMMRMWQGAYGLASREGLVSPAYVVLKPKRSIDPQFAAFLLESPQVRYRLWAYSYGLTDDRLRLYFPDFARIPVFVPPIDTQRYIARTLSTWDEAVRTLDRLIDVAARERNAQLGKLTHWLRFGGVAVRWSTLGEVAKLVSGGTPSKEEWRYWGGAIPWISAKDMKSVYVSDSELRITETARGKVRIVPKGTVLVLTRGMTLLRTVPICITAMDAAFNQDVKALLPKPGINSEFLAYALLAQERGILDLVDTAGHGTGRLETEALRLIPVPVPSEHTQCAVASAMSSLERAIQLYSSQRDQLRLERHALLQRLVRPDAGSQTLRRPGHD